MRDEFDAFLECGILAHACLRLRCGDCEHHELLALSCKHRALQSLVRRVADVAGGGLDSGISDCSLLH